MESPVGDANPLLAEEEGGPSTSLESESAVSFVTQIDVTTIHTSSEPTRLVPIGLEQVFPSNKDKAGEVGDAEETMKEEEEEEVFVERRSKYETKEEEEDELIMAKGEIDHQESYEDGEEDEDDTTVSSEAVVDDIELILMPEIVQDLPQSDLSPQLVRVTELKRCSQGGSYRSEGELMEDFSDQESDFKKMESEDETGEDGGGGGGFISSRSRGDDDILGGGGRMLRRSPSPVEEDDPSSSAEVFVVSEGGGYGGGGGRPSGIKVSSGVQTDITALESPFPCEFRGRKTSLGKSRLGVTPSSSNNKRLNWKSELTLLPSKTKITASGFNTPFDSINDHDQYSSPRVAKFTSQDTLNTSSCLMKPSTLYRTRNLSRNLNECDASDSTLMMPPRPAFPLESPRFRDRMSVSTSTSNFKESTAAIQSYSAYHISSAVTATSKMRQQPVCFQPSSTSSSRNFRSSLPDLSSKLSSDNKGRRQVSKSMKYEKSVASGQKLHKKSSSDDETSSLIDESERCLRSSIDLLLTDDLPSPGTDLSCRSMGFASSNTYGYYSSRRSHSQPVLFDDEDSGDYKDSSMGSPFLPRKLSDMRCSRWAKVILPHGQVAVVAVKEMDEVKDLLSVHTDSGCVITIPFRKVVFAWKRKR